ncbi:MAG TPA: class F sortase [Mycobacteriales bacterium]|nr:class F sortase [Mycobacteriales bacterium]
MAVVLVLVAAGCLAVSLRGPQHLLAGPAPQLASPSAGDPAPAPSGAVGPGVARSAPVALRIPAIGVAVSVSELGLNPDRTVQVPTDFQEPGWLRLGPSPGQMGSAVILGHVDSYRGPAVFFRLRYLRAGDRVEVRLADGVVAHFVVSRVAMYPKEQFPAQQVYGSHGYSALQLVTCGGEFDTHTRSYLSNVVAYTSLVATTPVAAPTAAAGPTGQK